MSAPNEPSNEPMVDVVWKGVHSYWSTHCRHNNHTACQATEIAQGVPRKPAQCKTCEAPCICACHATVPDHLQHVAEHSPVDPYPHG